MKNTDIARSFKLLADLMELHGENAFRTKAYRNAYNALRKYDRPLEEMREDELAEIQGVGSSTAAKIVEMNATGSMSRLEEYRKKTPPGIEQLLGIRGLGPSKVRAVWDGLGVETPGELLYACNENRLVELSGFGLKTQEDIMKKLEYYLESRDKRLYAAIEDNVEVISGWLNDAFPDSQVAVVGEVARRCPIVHDIEFLLGKSVSLNGLSSLEGISVESDEPPFKCRQKDGPAFQLHVCAPDEFVRRKFELTGTPEFVGRFDLNGEYKSEPDIFKSNGVAYVIPELRDSEGILDREYPSPDDLVSEVAITGILHNHSTYSDGLHTLREMSEYVMDSGYAYFGISDHSQTAVYAGGLKPDEVLTQFEEVDQLNRELAPFRVFKGIESDILADGSLDYDDDLLAQFDFVVASIHSGLKMDEEKATQRLIRAIEHPATTILGHPTSRLLLARQGYPVDHKKLIDACAANRVAIELNANPLRLDIDYTWIPYAMEKGVWISINPDAHARGQIHNVKYGIYAARKGGLLKSMCLNALSLEEFEKWLGSRS